MIRSLSPFEASREQPSTGDCQWLIDCYLPYLRRGGRRRYGGSSGVVEPPAPVVLEEWQDPETGQSWIDPETGLPWLDPES